MDVDIARSPRVARTLGRYVVADLRHAVIRALLMLALTACHWPGRGGKCHVKDPQLQDGGGQQSGCVRR